MQNINRNKLKEITDLIDNKGYQYYYNDAYHFRPRMSVNCSDEICPGSNERTSKIRQLMHKKILIGSDNFGKQYGEILAEMHSLILEETMALTGLTEREARLWIEYNINFNYVKKHVTHDGEEYLSIDPKIENKYER